MLFIPITEIVTQITQNVLSKCVKPKLIPKMDYSAGIPDKNATMVVIPTILKSGEDSKKALEKLEVYYLANKSENIYCTLLGDCTSSSKEKEDFDDEIVKQGLYEVNKLNEKYSNDKNVPIFNFMYRKRKWNFSEKIYMGWERKRGLLTEFNDFLQTKKIRNNFLVNTLEKQDIKIKYVITLDADTELPLNSRNRAN